MNSLIDQFTEKITSFFSTNLIFAFIPGSAARNELACDSDVDMFVLIKKEDPISINKFKQWYMEYHKKFGLTPDLVYPGEIVTEQKLDKTLKLITAAHPTKVIKVEQTYDGIVWAGMLISPNIGFVGEKRKFEQYRNISFMICKKWIKELKIDNSTFKGMDILLKKNINYEPF